MHLKIIKIVKKEKDETWRITLSPISLEYKSKGKKIIIKGMNDETEGENLKSITFQKQEVINERYKEVKEFTQTEFTIDNDRLSNELSIEQFYQENRHINNSKKRKCCKIFINTKCCYLVKIFGWIETIKLILLTFFPIAIIVFIIIIEKIIRYSS